MALSPARRPGREADRRSQRSDRGAALVEFAIVFPVFIVLLLGVVDFGVNFGDKVLTSNAAREAARQGAVSQVGSDSTCGLDPNGSLTVLTEQTMCLAKARTHMDPSRVRVKIFYEGPHGKETANYQPAAGSQTSTAAIVVCVMTQASSMSGMFSPIFDDQAHKNLTIIKTGAAPGSPAKFPAAGEEFPLTGQDWSFCHAEDTSGMDS